METDFILLLILYSFVGVICGTFTGLIPGIHPNNIALILTVVLSSAFLYFHPLLLSSFILSTAVTHTFVSFIPSAFIGAPDAETALNVLPAHAMLLEGRAYEAVALSAIGSFFAVICAFAFLIPFHFAMNTLHFYDVIRSVIPYLLIFISVLLILTESFKEMMEPVEAIISSSFVFLMSGVFGCIILNMNLGSPLFHFSSSALFPALTGLFGLSTIIFSLLHTPEIPAQRVESPSLSVSRGGKSALIGSASGMLVSFLPGVTAAHATVIAAIVQRSRENINENLILTLSAVNTANAIFCLFTLFTLMKARSGVTVAIQKIMHVYQWSSFIPYQLSYLLISVIFSSLLAYFITIFIGKHFSIMLECIPYRFFLAITALFLISLVFILSGFLGVLILAVATAIGIVPISIGVRRSNCMGVLLLNTILSYLLG